LKFQYVDVKNNNYNDVMLSMEKKYIDMNIDSFDGIDNILIMISPFKS
jgi:AAA15 family ATPase/GTPase